MKNGISYKMHFKYLYGPVSSWRLGISLGVDPICVEKVCSFDCIYCQLGKTFRFEFKRKRYIDEDELAKELKRLPLNIKIDYISISGMGEPTLAKNLSSIIRIIRKIRREKIAILTNSSLFINKETHKDLESIDFVIAKLDANSEKTFQLINRPMQGIFFKDILRGLKKFRKVFKNRFALQIMFTVFNKDYAEQIAKISKEFLPHEIQINTPLRPSKIKPLSKIEISQIRYHFRGIPAKIIDVYESRRKKKIVPFCEENTFRRRGEL